MISLKRISAWCFIVCFATLIPSVLYIKVIDELAAGVLAGMIVVGCIVNGGWKRYRMLWLLMGIITLYTVYSIAVTHYNTVGSIMVDAVIESKPFVPFIAFMVIRPEFTAAERKVLMFIAVANCVICAGALCGGMPAVRPVVNHPAYAGAFIYVSILVLCYLRSRSTVRLRGVILVFSVIMLIMGLLCGRSKFYGYAFLFVFFMFFYRPGMMRSLSLRHVCVLLIFAVSTVAVGWNKFSYYFLTGGSERFDPEVIESFARPVLYITGAQVMADHIPFGSGLASFASYASSKPYSSLYHEYGIDKVYGLSEANSDFICDAYYPLLAQFGIAGVVLFVAFFVYIYRRVARYTRIRGVRGRMSFATGMLCIGFVLIESTGSTMLVQPGGQIAMMLLGLICGDAPEVEPSPGKNTKPEVIYG